MEESGTMMEVRLKLRAGAWLTYEDHPEGEASRKYAVENVKYFMLLLPCSNFGYEKWLVVGIYLTLAEARRGVFRNRKLLHLVRSDHVYGRAAARSPSWIAKEQPGK